MSPRFVLAVVYPDRFGNEVRPMLDLPPGHHHVHIGEDGTYTAVPMRLRGFVMPEGLRISAAMLDADDDVLWVNAPTGGDRR